MHVRRTIAAALVAVFVIQSAGMAQAETAPDARAVPREQAVQILLSNLKPGIEVRVQTSGGKQVLGRFVESANDEIVLDSSGLRQVIPLGEVVSIRRPLPPARIGDGTAFGIGAAAGVGLLMTVLFVGAFAAR